MTDISTGSGSTIHIGPTTAVTFGDVSGYAALAFTKVGGGGTIGDFGSTAALVTFDGLEDDYTTKGKGIRNAGSIQCTFAYNAQDDGQQDVIAAEGTKKTYAFKVTAADAKDSNDTDSVWYFHALVMSAVIQIGGPNDVTRLQVTLEVSGGITPDPSSVVSGGS